MGSIRLDFDFLYVMHPKAHAVLDCNFTVDVLYGLYESR